MANNSTDTSAQGEGSARQEQLAELLWKYIDRMNSGESLDESEILAEQPDLGPDLIRELQTFEGLGTSGVGCGDTLGTIGDYTLRRQLGRGGMGVVYEAWDSSMERQVALKVLPGGAAADEKTFHRFLREARTAGMLNHPNVVTVHGVGIKERTPYYAMEYVEGETLSQILKRQRSTPGEGEPRAEPRLGARGEGEPPGEPLFGASRTDPAFYSHLARAFAEVADGLQHAHSHGIVHRDIKPSNLILDAGADRGGRAKRLRILDFGLARLEGQKSLTVSGDVVGTPSYMSPEQAKRRQIPVDNRTDVYSLGATLYEALTLAPPFRGKDYQDTLSQITERDPRPPRQLNSRVPPDLETIVLKCLRKDPGDRYCTAEALGQDLRRFAREEPIEARPESAWERVGRRLSRHRTPVLVSCLFLVLAFAGLILSTVLIARARNQARRDLYVANTNRAMADWQSGNYNRFVDLVGQHVPDLGDTDLRGWEWYYLNGLTHRDGRWLGEHDGEVRAVDWSPDGSRIASGGVDGVVRVWDPETRPETDAELEHFSHPGTVLRVAWSPDGSRLAVGVTEGYREGTVAVWDMNTRDKLYTLPNDNCCTMNPPTWAPDGRLAIASGGIPEVKIWDGHGEHILTLSEGIDANDLVWMAEFSPEGDRLAASSRWGRVVIWDAHTGERLHLFSPGRVRALAWSADGHRLAWNRWREIEIVDLSNRAERPLRLSGHEGAVYALDWHEDGILASAATDGLVHAWDVATGTLKRTFRGHRRGVRAISFNPAGNLLASASADRTVRVWDLAEHQDARTLEGRAPVSWSPDGQYLAVKPAPEKGSQGSLRVYETENFEEKFTRVKDFPSCKSLDWSPDSQRIAVARNDGWVRIWGCPGGEEYLAFKAGKQNLLQVDWSPDGKWIATSRIDPFVRLWYAHTGTAERTLEGHTRDVGAIAWSPDGDRLASLSIDHVLIVWDVANPEEPLRRRLERTTAGLWFGHRYIAWSPSGEEIAAGTWGGTVFILDARSGDEILKLEGHTSSVRSVAWSPDGLRLATGSEDRTVKIWDMTSGDKDELLTLRGHEGEVRSVAWSPDGLRLATAGMKCVKIWDARPGYESDAVAE